MDEPPSPSAIDCCVSVLRALTPHDLEQPHLAPLKDVGTRLFKSSIMKSAFDGKDVVEFLEQKTQHQQMLRELKRLEKLVRGEHRRERIQASECGLNAARKLQLEMIKAECAEHATPRITSLDADTAAVATIGLAAASACSVHVALRFDGDGPAPSPPCYGVASGLGGGHGHVDGHNDVDEKEAWPSEQEPRSQQEQPPPSQQQPVPPPTRLPPQGDLRRICNVCRGDYTSLPRHPFYHQLCPRCGDLNWEKRLQSADMHGMVAVVTGGRVRIGYATVSSSPRPSHAVPAPAPHHGLLTQCPALATAPFCTLLTHFGAPQLCVTCAAQVLKLLRAGATVVTTSRFPCDAALRYSREAGFATWGARLSVVGPLELSDIRMVESFCAALVARFPRIHVLINNAAQTLTRPEGWNVRMGQLEQRAASELPPPALAMLQAPATLAAPPALVARGDAASRCAEESTSIEEAAAAAEGGVASGLRDTATPIIGVVTGGGGSSGGGGGGGGISGGGSSSNGSSSLLGVRASSHDKPHTTILSAAALADFPEGLLDESRQPLDLSGLNSWSRRLGEVDTLEVVQTLAANAAAPFILCNRLAKALTPCERGDAGGGGPCSHVINVTAVEGKFSVGKKSHAHPHTNMGKAALNMLTFTSASSFYQQRRILMNSVDTGWVTDMAPGGVGVISARHATHVGPPLDEEDGAARVLDPIFSHLKDPTWRIRGYCFRNYFAAGW